MTDLSPAAQATWKAFAAASSGHDYEPKKGLAHALRAVASLVAPRTHLLCIPDDYELGAGETEDWINRDLLAIADELHPESPTTKTND